MKQWRKPMPRHSSLEWCRWDSSSISYGCFYASMRQFSGWFPNWLFFMLLYKTQIVGWSSQTNFRTFETTDPSLDDANHTNSWNDGVNPCQGIQAWNGVDGTPLAVVMSVSMLLYITQILGYLIFPRPTSVHLRLLIHHWTMQTIPTHRTMADNHAETFKLGMVSMGLL